MDFKKEENLTEKQVEMFNRYMEILLQWNQKINLTAITDRNEINIKHFVDSLTISKYIDKKAKVIDIGTGAGFPGIPLKIADENLNVTLVDSLAKRVSFLNEVINELNLKEINAIHSRAEDLAHDANYRESYDVAVSRAVAKLSTLLEYMLPFVKVGGICICMKGPKISEELENSQVAIKKLGGELEKIDNFFLSNTEYERNIIIIKKKYNTPKMYPRNAGIPGKCPL